MKLKLVGAGLSAVMLGLLTAGPADATYGICPTTDYGRGCVYSGQAKVADDLVDGHSTLIQWDRGSGTTRYSLWDHDGAGNGFVYDSVDTSNHSTFRSRLCLGEWGTKDILSCGPWV